MRENNINNTPMSEINSNSSVTASPPIDNAPRKNNLVLILVILLIIGLVGTVAYLVIENNRLKTIQSKEITPISVSEGNNELQEIQQPSEEEDSITEGIADEGSNWTTKQFGDSWDITYPSEWEVNDDGMLEGSISMTGDYKGNTYDAGFYYPIALGYDIPTEVESYEDLPQNVDEWVQKEISLQPEELRGLITVENTVIDGAPARIVKNMALADENVPSNVIYIWEQGDKNQRVVSITQIDGNSIDTDVNAELIDRIAAGLK